VSAELKQSLGGESGLPIVRVIAMALLITQLRAQAHTHSPVRAPTEPI
jgi:hypothetical protein